MPRRLDGMPAVLIIRGYDGRVMRYDLSVDQLSITLGAHSRAERIDVEGRLVSGPTPFDPGPTVQLVEPPALEPGVES